MRLNVRDLQEVVNQVIKEASSGVAMPKTTREPFDIHGKKRIGDAGKQGSAPELSDFWYEEKARKFLQDYGSTRTIEFGWKEAVVHRFCSSVKATSGVDIDEKKLLDAVKKQETESDDDMLDRMAKLSLKETIECLNQQELMSESFMPIIEDVFDPVMELVESQALPQAFIAGFNQLFTVCQASLPASLKKFTLHESVEMTIPVVATLPVSKHLRSIDEVACDTYVKHWNARQALLGEPIVLGWDAHPGEMNKITFKATLK